MSLAIQVFWHFRKVLRVGTSSEIWLLQRSSYNWSKGWSWRIN